jgi:hypothetical protein
VALHEDIVLVLTWMGVGAAGAVHLWALLGLLLQDPHELVHGGCTSRGQRRESCNTLLGSGMCYAA